MLGVDAFVLCTSEIHAPTAQVQDYSGAARSRRNEIVNLSHRDPSHLDSPIKPRINPEPMT